MKILALNKKATFDYQILETFEAGMILFGYEVKSIRAGQMSLKGTYISFKVNKKNNNEAYLIGAFIPLYKPAGVRDDYKPDRPRKILLKKKEINHLVGKKQEKGLTVIPVKVYTNSSFIKLEIAVVKGKKAFDKREDSKKKDIDKHIRILTKKRIKEH
ncbi:MAG: SsrA-binding protein SmpB [Patescibacteria group bacterium]|nr:SsrA-binding protein SmpB [Patescibacteria group bacterium]